MSDKSKLEDIDKDKSNMGEKKAVMQEGSSERNDVREDLSSDQSQGSDLMNEVLSAINADNSANNEEVQDGRANFRAELGDQAFAQELLQKEQEIEKLHTELAASQDKYLRMLADFENFKKRSVKERSDLLKYQGEQLVQDLVRVIDDLELAVSFSAASSSDLDPHKILEGLSMINKNFIDTLAKWGIRAESALGQQFDPQKHMAISKIAAGDSAPGTVVSELKKLYFYKDKILRVAEVVVASE